MKTGYSFAYNLLELEQKPAQSPWCGRRESNPHGSDPERVLSLLRLPVSPRPHHRPGAVSITDRSDHHTRPQDHCKSKRRLAAFQRAELPLVTASMDGPRAKRFSSGRRSCSFYCRGPVVRRAPRRTRMDHPPEALTSESRVAEPRTDPARPAACLAPVRDRARSRERKRESMPSISRAALPELVWQPTDRDADALRSIAAHRSASAPRQSSAADPARCLAPAVAGASRRCRFGHQHDSHLALARHGRSHGALRPSPRAGWSAPSLRALSGNRPFLWRPATQPSMRAFGNEIPHGVCAT